MALSTTLSMAKSFKGATHKDANGKVMYGAKHTASSKFLVHKKDTDGHCEDTMASK